MTQNHFADIILPLAVKGNFTYLVPDGLAGKIRPGIRVLVQFGNKKLYAAIVTRLHEVTPEIENIRPIIEVLDNIPVADETQLKFWSWMSDYYMCTPGEVMKAALPSILCLQGEKSVPVTEKYKPKEETFIKLASGFTETEMNEILDKLGKAPKQYDLLIAFLRISNYSERSAGNPVRKSLVLRESRSGQAILDALIRKQILSTVSLETGRLKDQVLKEEPVKPLSSAQSEAIVGIRNHFRDKNIVLLHGVTSSGKTEIYIHLIEEQLKLGKQVLYLLPEIALTTQIINRLIKHFGRVTGVYHSRFSDAEKVEIRIRVAVRNTDNGYRLVIGVRSALFLPFNDLGLIIVDEEQDSSYKQHDPAPRYHARDSAVVLAGIHKAKTLLGSASPSIESYNNSLTGKYGLVEITERYGLIKLPEIVLANTREAYRKKLMTSHFTPQLIESIDEALGNHEQVILFQNRRGFSPYIECPECGWIPKCIQCAVNLTYHKGINRLVCHYCGYSTGIPSQCGNCHSLGMTTRGFGTEKIEDEIRIIFPAAKVARLDQDTTRGKNSFNTILEAFEEKRTDILIGTQMISKGLDFENLTVVGVLNADNLLNFPDFRAHERSFQMLEQVSGRAGRRQKQGRVVIQTSDPDNKIIRLVLNHDYKNMFRFQAEERKAFNYPPFCRMIKIIIKHRDRAVLNRFSDILGDDLRSKFGKKVLGPEFPLISQIQLWYIKTILIKLEREKSIAYSKNLIAGAIERVEKEKGTSGLRIAVDVDPY
jgi:primosomal protein N' (replication factor Y)